MGQRFLLAGLIRIDLPARTLRIADGGMVPWDDAVWPSKDDDFGGLAALEPLAEGLGDTAPALTLSFMLPDGVAAADVCSGAFQGSRVRAWIAEIDPDAGTVIGDPDQMIDGQIDIPRLRLAAGKRALEIDIVSRAERTYLGDEGNTQSDAFHQGIWPGETGFANADGVPKTVAWGVASPPRGTVTTGGSVSGGGAGGGLQLGNAFQ